MELIEVDDFEQWRGQARDALARQVPPAELHFTPRTAQQLLFDEAERHGPKAGGATLFRVPKQFLQLARRVACHADAGRYDLLYRVLWRLSHCEPHLLEVTTDNDVAQLDRMEKAVRRDAHKMKAFVRFRKLEAEGQQRYVAWHTPDHRVLGLVADFFARRFSAMHWTIFTPFESATWDGSQLVFGGGVSQSHVPAADELDDLWRTYYASIFNPARVKVKAMVREMPVRYWHTMPETELIPELLRQAPRRVDEMVDRQQKNARTAQDYLPATSDLTSLRVAAECCKGCDLYKDATQTVFGEGAASARLMLVGEQPGDEEDRQGRPFVGAAGQVLDDAMAEAGIDRNEVYVTNAVKHFKFIMRGKRRLHKKPGAREMAACSAWLHAELEAVKPEVVLCLGATAAQSLLGRTFRITQQRGQFLATDWCDLTMATYHPSAVLRASDEEHRNEIRGHLVTDLQAVARRLGLRQG